MKVVVNRGCCYFHLPDETVQILINKGWSVTECDAVTYQPIDNTADIMLTLGGVYQLNFKKISDFENQCDFRTHKDFIDIVENNLSKELIEQYPQLEVIDISDNIEFYIDADDESGGFEIIHEKHRSW